MVMETGSRAAIACRELRGWGNPPIYGCLGKPSTPPAGPSGPEGPAAFETLAPGFSLLL
jgi:hypothetical protein